MSKNHKSNSRQLRQKYEYNSSDDEISDSYQNALMSSLIALSNKSANSTDEDKKRFEHSCEFSLMPYDTDKWVYYFQAKQGYRISKLELSADIEIVNNKDLDIPFNKFPFKSTGYDFLAPNPNTYNPKELHEWPSYKEIGRQWVHGTQEYPVGIHSIQLAIFRRINKNRCHQWKIHAEFIPETGKDTQMKMGGDSRADYCKAHRS